MGGGAGKDSSLFYADVLILVDWFVSEEEYHVQTCAVLVDFCSEREVYDKIWEAIEDKEIGILGLYIFFY